MRAIGRRLDAIARRFQRVTSGGSYVPQIDGLRFVAIMPVMIWHACIRGARMARPGSPEHALYWLPHGYVGVEFFFFISGYIISYPFLAGRAPSLGSFYVRRVYRLEPPYIVAMVAAFLALQLSGYRPTDALSFNTAIPLWQSLVASLFYLHGAVFHTVSTLNPPAWSLEVEIQFYLLSPFVLAAYLSVRSPRLRRIAIVALGLGLVLVSAWLDTVYGRWGVHRLTLLGHAAPFLLGVVVCDQALAGRWLQRPPHALADLALLVGLPAMLATGYFELRNEMWIGIPRDLCKLAAMMLVYLGAVRGPWGRRCLGAAPIALVGGMCYSIYLTHVPVMQAASTVLRHVAQGEPLAVTCALCVVTLVPLAIVVGFVFYVLIERPCMERDWPQRLIRRIVRPAATMAPGGGRHHG